MWQCIGGKHTPQHSFITPIYNVSAVPSIIMLTLSSIILGTCLVNASRDVYDRHLVETTSIVLEHSNTSDLKKIFYYENEVGIKDNIKSKNMYLNPVLRMINIDGSKTEDRKKRREIDYPTVSPKLASPTSLYNEW